MRSELCWNISAVVAWRLLGALARMEAGRLHLSAIVLSADGTRRLAADQSGSASEAVVLGRRVAESLLAQGAAELIAAARVVR